MAKRKPSLGPQTVHADVESDDVLTAVKDALEALRKAFLTNGETSKQELATDPGNPRQPSEDPRD